MAEETSNQPAPKPSLKKRIIFVLKIALSAAMLFTIFRKVVQRDGADALMDHLTGLHWGWFVAAILMQVIAIGFSTVRWQRLLLGQGIRAPWRFLGGSIMIARFWGAVTPGGFTGFGGWRIYDVAKQTGKTARATATIGVETILGQLAFGVVVMAGSIFGFEFIGTQGVILVNVFFVTLIGTGLLFLSRPNLFRVLAKWLPRDIQNRIQTLVDAVCAYHGKFGLLSQAALLGIGTHAFNNLIYVCAARALGVELSVGMVFFGSSLQIFATLIPASINGIGLRETAAVALYTAVGVAGAQAVLIPIVGFAAEMLVSACGGLVFMLRGADYKADIQVEDAEREQAVYEAIGEVTETQMPGVVRGGFVGLAAGLFGGALVGLGEAAVIISSGEGQQELLVLAYGPVLYGVFCGAGGAFAGAFMAWTGRLMKRAALLESDAFGRYVGIVVAFFGLALGAFRIRRDVFHEELVWKSLQGLGVLLGVAACAGLVCVLLAWGVPRVLRAGAFRRIFIAPDSERLRVSIFGLPVGLVVLMALGGVIAGPDAQGHAPVERTGAPEGAGPVLYIVVDTLRADALPGYGAEGLSTPHLDAFAEDSIRFDQAFVNASWTRPSFASLMTGRYPRNHGVMSKADRLPEEITTIGEAFADGGYQTGGFVTNFNVAPFFGFHQGFDSYEYMEPNFPLGADDASAKLLLHQFLRQRIEKWRAARGQVEPGGAYQDAETVNRAISEWLDAAPTSPWFLFVGYMDPHDPYFEHPYNGTGYSRAANQNPDPSEAPELWRLYRQEIEYWDTEFGRLVADLRRRGLYDDLTIVITSDHGEEFCDHGGFWHGTTLYDEQLRVPLYLKLPQGRRAGTSVRHWVQSIDIMPTLLEESGLSIPEGVQGRSLFEGTSEVYAWESHEGNELESVRRREGTDEVKLITANPGNPRGLSPVELYRVDFDPGETENIAAAEPAEVESTMEALIAARESAAEGALEATTVGLEGDAAERLRALGYISDEE